MSVISESKVKVSVDGYSFIWSSGLRLRAGSATRQPSWMYGIVFGCYHPRTCRIDPKPARPTPSLRKKRGASQRRGSAKQKDTQKMTGVRCLLQTRCELYRHDRINGWLCIRTEIEAAAGAGCRRSRALFCIGEVRFLREMETMRMSGGATIGRL